MDNTVWVLTESYNDYDQHGEYLVAVFKEKPTVRELAEFFKYTKTGNVAGNVFDALDFLLGLLENKGRRGYEEHWYNLSLLEFGEKFS